MFGGSKMAAEEAAMGNVRPRNLSTNEQGPILPLVAGKQRVGAVFLTEPLQVYLAVIRNTSGKGKLSSSQDVHANFATAHCRGPIDGIHKIIIDDRIEWEGNLLRADYPNHVDIPLVQTRASSVRILWGTHTQTIQNTAPVNLVSWDNNFPHPAYRGQCYAIWGTDPTPPSVVPFYIGRNRDSIPNIELIVSRYPDPSWFTAAAVIDGECNPAAFIADLLMDPMVGPGLPEARLDTASFNAAGATLASEGLGISPIVTRAQNVRQLLAEAFAIIDGYFFVTPAGKIGLGLIRAPGGGLTAVNEANMTDRLQLEPENWPSTLNGLGIVFQNREEDYNANLVPFNDAGNFRVVGVSHRKTLQRPWITSRTVAERVALSTGAREALPEMKGSIRVRRSVGKLLTPGTAFALTSADQGLAALTARVQKQLLPSPKGLPAVRIDWVIDRSYLNANFVVPEVSAHPAAGITIWGAFQRAIEWPWMRAYNLPQVAVMTTRTERVVGSFFLHAKKPSGSYEQWAHSPAFVIFGTVSDYDYPITTTIDDGLGMVVDLDGPDQEVTTGQSLQDALLGDWVAVVDSEILGVYGAELVSAGRYRFKTIRGRFDTVAESHALGNYVYLFRLQEAPLFPGLMEMSTQGYKVQELVRGALGNMGLELSVTTSRRWERPVEPQNLAAFADAANPTYTTGQDVPLTWSVANKKRVGFWEIWQDGWTEDQPETILEFRTTGGILKQTVEIAANFGDESDDSPAGNSYTVLNTDLAAWFAGEVTFDIRAYHRMNGYRSIRFDSLRVTKI